MLLREAKEILKKNGYKLVEEYDAVTDRNNSKNYSHEYSYTYGLDKRLRRALQEEGFNVKITGFRNIRVENTSGEVFYVDWWMPKFKAREIPSHRGHQQYSTEQDKWKANFSEMENDIELHIESKAGSKKDDMSFDVRNTPGMVKWIISFIEK